MKEKQYWWSIFEKIEEDAKEEVGSSNYRDWYPAFHRMACELELSRSEKAKHKGRRNEQRRK